MQIERAPKAHRGVSTLMHVGDDGLPKDLGGINFPAPKTWMIIGGIAALGWFLALFAVNRVVDSAVSGIDSDSTAQLANELFTGITSSLNTLLLILGVVAALAATGVGIWGWYQERAPETLDTPAV